MVLRARRLERSGGQPEGRPPRRRQPAIRASYEDRLGTPALMWSGELDSNQRLPASRLRACDGHPRVDRLVAHLREPCGVPQGRRYGSGQRDPRLSPHPPNVIDATHGVVADFDGCGQPALSRTPTRDSVAGSRASSPSSQRCPVPVGSGADGARSPDRPPHSRRRRWRPEPLLARVIRLARRSSATPARAGAPTRSRCARPA